MNPGDHVLVASIGNFGERWKKLNATWGAEVTALDYEWGTKADPADIEKALAADPAIKAVYVQHSETSTGVVNDIKAIGEIVARTPAILVVDAISGLGATDLQDRRVARRHLRRRLPEGAHGAAGPRLRRPSARRPGRSIEQCTTPRFYFDFVAMRKKMTGDSAQTPYTPAVTSWSRRTPPSTSSRKRACENVFERHRVLGKAARRASRRSASSSSPSTTPRPTP